MDNVHIIPIDDLKPHQTSTNCACQPYRDEETENLIIHNAWDGREFAEQEESEIVASEHDIGGKLGYNRANWQRKIPNG